MIKIEYSQPIGVTSEANLSAINFSNALSSFIGHSVLISKKIEQNQFKEFIKLKERWNNETIFASSGSEIISNSAYKKIISKGTVVLPWIIRDLKRTNNHWFFALEQITGENPIKPLNIGKVEDMKADWLNWATDKNVL